MKTSLVISQLAFTNSTPSELEHLLAKAGSIQQPSLMIYRKCWVQESGIQSVTVSESTPLSIVVNNPDEFTANITLTLDCSANFFFGPTLDQMRHLHSARLYLLIA